MFSNAIILVGNFKRNLCNFAFRNLVISRDAKSLVRFITVVYNVYDSLKTIALGCGTCNFSPTVNSIAGPVNSDYCGSTCNELVCCTIHTSVEFTKQSLHPIADQIPPAKIARKITNVDFGDRVI